MKDGCAQTTRNQSNAYKYFSSKTPYEWMHPPDESTIEDKWFNEKIDGLMCSAVHTSIVARHGTRFPGHDDILKIIEIHKRLHPGTVDSIPGFKEWKNPFPENDRKSLADLGESELQGLGRRTAQRLFSLFAEEDIDSFRYIISSKERTRDSAQAFYEGFVHVLQEEVDEEDDEYEPEIVDKLLRFHEICEKYKVSVGENKTAMKEYYAFENGPLVKNIRTKITQKLHVPEDTLTGGKCKFSMHTLVN
jgi:multiple inositol-polyphosphate phosphatase/2,3-bisphosphoglycerate 3-phosphatase